MQVFGNWSVAGVTGAGTGSLISTGGRLRTRSSVMMIEVESSTSTSTWRRNSMKGMMVRAAGVCFSQEEAPQASASAERRGGGGGG